jgi:hypothetical protein
VYGGSYGGEEQALNSRPVRTGPYYPSTAQTPQPLNLKIENLNATTSKKEYGIRLFRAFSIIREIFRIFQGL